MKTIATFFALVILTGWAHAQDLVKIQENGNKTTYALENGIILFTTTTPEGALIETGGFLDGRPHGEWIQYNKEGLIIGQATYVFGDKQGQWLIWNEDKTVLFEISYVDNQRVSAVKWTMDDAQMVNKD